MSDAISSTPRNITTGCSAVCRMTVICGNHLALSLGRFNRCSAIIGLPKFRVPLVNLFHAFVLLHTNAVILPIWWLCAYLLLLITLFSSTFAGTGVQWLSCAFTFWGWQTLLYWPFIHLCQWCLTSSYKNTRNSMANRLFWLPFKCGRLLWWTFSGTNVIRKVSHILL